jgi:AraC-like DNA-binding protein
VHRIHAPENEKNGYANNIVNEFITLLKKNYKEKRETSFYAKKLCITPKYLTTLLKDITGKTVHEWIDEYVSVESKALLRSTKMTIDQISDSLSFSSQDNFSKFFKRVVGISPTEYRKRY